MTNGKIAGAAQTPSKQIRITTIRYIIRSIRCECEELSAHIGKLKDIRGGDNTRGGHMTVELVERERRGGGGGGKANSTP